MDPEAALVVYCACPSSERCGSSSGIGGIELRGSIGGIVGIRRGGIVGIGLGGIVGPQGGGDISPADGPGVAHSANEA